MAKTITYEQFQNMVRLAPPNSGLNAKSIATSIEKKGYTLPPELSGYSSITPQETTEAKKGFFDSVGSRFSNPMSPFSQENQVEQAPLEDILPVAGGAIGSAFGPLGTFAGTAIGLGAQNLVKNVKDISAGVPVEDSLLSDVGVPVAKGAFAGILHKGVNVGTNQLSKGVQTLRGKTPGDVQSLVQPKITDKLIQETAQKNPDLIKPGGLLTKGKVLPSAGEKELAQTAQSIPGFGTTDDVVKNVQVVKQTIGSEAKALGTTLKANDAALPRQQIAAAMKRGESEAIELFGNEQAAVKQFQGVMNLWKKVSAKHPGNTSGQWKARIEFDDELERQFGKRVFDPTLERPVHAAVRTVRQVANEQIDLASGGIYSPAIKRMSQMYDILENMSGKVGKETLESGVQKVMKSRGGKAAIYGATGAAGAGTIFDLAQ